MKNFFYILLSLMTYSTLSAQITLHPKDGAVKVETKDGKQMLVDACWCYPEYQDDSLTEMHAITYPLPVKKNGKWGAIDKTGEQIADFKATVPVLYTDKGKVQLEGFKYERYQWEMEEDTAFLYQLDSTDQLTQTFRVVDVYKGTFLATPDNYFWGLINSKMETLVEFKYTSSHYKGEQFKFNDKGYVTLRENKSEGLNGVVDYKGDVIIPFKWKLLSYIIEDENHIYAANEHKRRGYIDIEGHTILPFMFIHLPRVLKDSNLVKTEDYIYFIDRDLKRIGPKYEAFDKEGNVFFFKQNGKWGVMDENYKIIIPHKYGSIMYGPRLKDDREFRSYIVVENGKYGLVTLKGETIVRPQFDCLCGHGYYAPSNYYVGFKKDGISYKYDHEGKLVEKGGKAKEPCFCE